VICEFKCAHFFLFSVSNGDVTSTSDAPTTTAALTNSAGASSSSSSGTCPRPKKGGCLGRKGRGGGLETSSGGRRLSVDRRFLQQGRLERVMLHWNLKDATVTSDDWIGLYQLGEYLCILSNITGWKLFFGII